MNPEFLRAIYSTEHDLYVSELADWIDKAPTLAYKFALQRTHDRLLEGVLEKTWYDEQEGWLAESFVFGEFADDSAFASEVASIRDEAESTAEVFNVDTLLCIIDLLKERAVEAGLEDEDILDWEGCFTDGPEDAYTRRDIGDRNRLHHHLEREEECWRLKVKKVVDENGAALGWGVFVVFFPGLAIDAPPQAILAANEARTIMVEQTRDELDARLALRGIARFMDDGERVEDPDYAFMDDTMILSGLAAGPDMTADGNVIWRALRDTALQDFLATENPVVCPRAAWRPRHKSLVDQFFEEHPQPVWFEDQMRAMLADQAGVKPDDADEGWWADVLDDDEDDPEDSQG